MTWWLLAFRFWQQAAGDAFDEEDECRERKGCGADGEDYVECHSVMIGPRL